MLRRWLFAAFRRMRKARATGKACASLSMTTSGATFAMLTAGGDLAMVFSGATMDLDTATGALGLTAPGGTITIEDCT